MTRVSDDDEKYARDKFGTQKGISSDEFFGRNDFDPNAKAEAKDRLQGFEGATSISSNAYFGRPEEEGAESIDYGNYGDLEGAARDFVRKFGVTAGDDLDNLTRVVGEGATKLQGKHSQESENMSQRMADIRCNRRHTKLPERMMSTPSKRRKHGRAANKNLATCMPINKHYLSTPLPFLHIQCSPTHIIPILHSHPHQTRRRHNQRLRKRHPQPRRLKHQPLTHKMPPRDPKRRHSQLIHTPLIDIVSRIDPHDRRKRSPCAKQT